MSEEQMAIVQAFVDALDGEKDYEKAAEFLADEFKMTTPLRNFKGKEDWIEHFPAFHKDAPTFDSLGINSNGQVVRNGKKKMGFITMKVHETYHFNSSGKIERLAAGLF